MEKFQILNDQDCEDLARGADFMSASGGGPRNEALSLMKNYMGKGLVPRIEKLHSIDDDAWAVVTFFSGSVAPTRYARGDSEKKFGLVSTVMHPTMEAVLELEARTGRVFDAIVPVELGGNNTLQAVACATALDKTLVDADLAGRAIPEAMCTTAHLAGVSMTPFACVSYYDDRIYAPGSTNNQMAERLGKHIAMAVFGSVGCAAFVMDGRTAKRIAIAGTLSKAMEIGRTIRQLSENSSDVPAQLAERFPDIQVLFEGRVAKRFWENRDGYMWGEHMFEGSGAFSGRSMRVWFKNENHISWLDDAPYVCSPDVIEIVDQKSGEPLINSFLEEGAEVAVLGIRRSAAFDSQAGVELMGPTHWGFDIPYRPIESFFPNESG